jgi:hypothetical protein
MSPASGHLRQVDAVINALSDGKSGEQRLEELRQTRIASVEHQAGSADAKMDRNRRYTIWLFNIAMENGPFIDGLPGLTY